MDRLIERRRSPYLPRFLLRLVYCRVGNWVLESFGWTHEVDRTGEHYVV